MNLFKLLLLTFLLSSSLLALEDDNFLEDEFGEPMSYESYDPLKSYNIQMTKFNDFVYMQVFNPISKMYTKITPKKVRVCISNFFYNLAFPVRFINNILQLKIRNSIEESARFAINSTYGLGGFFDLATNEANLKKHNEDFGQTLGFYEIKNGVYIVLPLLGPSNLRDSFGLLVDYGLNPLNYSAIRDGYNLSRSSYNLMSGYNYLNEFSLHIKEYESIRKDSIDLYILLKNMYDQRREKLIKE